MKYRTLEDIRTLFISYFQERDHLQHSSHALIPADDPTLLFINAGMVQFKDVFTGRRTVTPPRATTSQKCLRVSGKHNDLENVGRTARHHTFFEMLGNFSFGDYFKEKAIPLAWTFLTDPEFIGMPMDDLWITVHPDDEEARRIWRDDVGVRPERILDDPENFWSMGDTGPCGYCSEIHIDQGKELSGGIEVPFGEGGDRYLELWNLVFMQYDRDAAGTLHPLPQPSIDTGMGLERIAGVVQGKQSNYDVDMFQPIFRRIEQLSGMKYRGHFAAYDDRMDPSVEEDVAFRVIADHARATVFLMADGIYPENEGRGYVLRRVMRRAIRFGRKLGLDGSFFATICDEVVLEMGAAYPELMLARDVIARIVKQEELRFGRTLVDGLKLLESDMAKLKASGATQVSGDIVFALYDTHGFPMDLTRLIAEEAGLGVDEAGFEERMASQRERGRSSWKGAEEEAPVYATLLDQGLRTLFTGYGEDEGEGIVLTLIVDGSETEVARVGDAVEIITDQTPFYGESGGQVGDSGWIRGLGNLEVRVKDTRLRGGEVYCHVGDVVSGVLGKGDTVQLAVDGSRRNATRRNHSATHLLHWALKEVLGDHVKQRGSLVGPDRLRFDFSHFEAVTVDEIVRVEILVNERIQNNQPVQTELLSYDAAVGKGATAFFGEKYGDAVRVVSMAESMELCGGTHVKATGDMGFLKVVSESGISSGVRRIEAATGMNVLQWMQEREAGSRRVANILRIGVSEVEGKVEKLLKDMQELNRLNETLKRKLASGAAQAGAAEERDIGGVKVQAHFHEGIEGKDLRSMSDAIRDSLGTGIFILGSACDGKIAMLVRLSDDLKGQLDAGALVRELAPLIGGRGGGKRTLAQAGGTVPSGWEKAKSEFFRMVEEGLG